MLLINKHFSVHFQGRVLKLVEPLDMYTQYFEGLISIPFITLKYGHEKCQQLKVEETLDYWTVVNSAQPNLFTETKSCN